MPTIRLSRHSMRKLAIILEVHDIDARDKATYNKEAAWIKRMAHRLRKEAARQI